MPLPPRKYNTENEKAAEILAFEMILEDIAMRHALPRTNLLDVVIE